MLTAAQHAQRDGKLTASRVACLMTGVATEVLDLWRLLVGDPNYREPDLSDVWPVQLGSCTEQLNLDWFERKHGPVIRRGDVVIGAYDWMAATLDGWSPMHSCPVECKHVGGREPFEVIIDRYQPQMHWQMLVTGARECALSVIMGANEPLVEFVPLDAAYAEELMKRAEAFMACVWSLTPPVTLPAAAAPVSATITYDLTGNNNWAAHAADWLDNIAGKRAAEAAEKILKELVPDDAKRCAGHGVAITRDRAGRLSLRESKQ